MFKTKFKFVGTRLSANANSQAVVVEHPQGVGNGVGKFVNQTSNGREFFMMDYRAVGADMKPFITSITVWANELTGKFDVSADDMEQMGRDGDLQREGTMRKFVDGDKFTGSEDTIKVLPYEIDGITYTHVTLPVFDGQDERDVLGAYNKTTATRQERAKAENVVVPLAQQIAELELKISRTGSVSGKERLQAKLDLLLDEQKGNGNTPPLDPVRAENEKKLAQLQASLLKAKPENQPAIQAQIDVLEEELAK